MDRGGGPGGDVELPEDVGHMARRDHASRGTTLRAALARSLRDASHNAALREGTSCHGGRHHMMEDATMMTIVTHVELRPGTEGEWDRRGS